MVSQTRQSVWQHYLDSVAKHRRLYELLAQQPTERKDDG